MSRFSSAAYLLARARTPEPPELAEMAWLQALLPNERERALADLKVVQVEVGELLCRVGRPVTYWFGVVDGLLKMSNDTAMGVPVTFTGIAPGGWFGEGTVIKREAQPGGAVPSAPLSGRRLAAAHHPAGARLPGRPVASTRP